MSEKSTWLLIGIAAGVVLLSLGMLPAAVSVSGPSILVLAALAWIVTRGASDLRNLHQRAQPYLRQAARALDDDALDCADCGRPLPGGALYCIRCGHRARAVTGKTEHLR